jgi:hypothetical protein
VGIPKDFLALGMGSGILAMELGIGREAKRNAILGAPDILRSSFGI